MPEVNQYNFTHREVLELLIKKAGLHEGMWQLSMTFGFTAANMGPNPEQICPGAAVVVQNLVLQKAQPDSPPALIADAAVVNPVST